METPGRKLNTCIQSSEEVLAEDVRIFSLLMVFKAGTVAEVATRAGAHREGLGLGHPDTGQLRGLIHQVEAQVNCLLCLLEVISNDFLFRTNHITFYLCISSARPEQYFLRKSQVHPLKGKRSIKTRIQRAWV